MTDPRRVHVVAFADRDPKWIFVPDTHNRGRYCRVPYWFAFTSCDHCGALEGQPCVSHQFGRTYTGVDASHVMRRHSAKRDRRWKGSAIPKEPEDILDDLHELWRDVVEGNSP